MLFRSHWDLEDWREWLIDEDEPGVRVWEPGLALPDPGLTNHLSRGVRGAAQRALYATGLVHAADLVLPRFPTGFRPERLEGFEAGAAAGLGSGAARP